MPGSALRMEMAMLSCSRARPGSASHGCWKRSSSTWGTHRTGCCARNVRRITATLCCTRFCSCYVINSTCGADLSDAENLQRVEHMLERIGRSTREARLLMAELLELRAQETLSQAEMTAAQRKNATLEILEAFLVAPLDGATVLLLLEDAHWSDPTTQTLIERLLGRIDSDHALIVVTHRPEMKAVWVDHLHVTPLRCRQLGREHCVALARHLASRWGIDDALLQEIASRSDGVPLYVKELTRAVLAQKSPNSDAVPLTLRDSLMARLDRLGGAKAIAQTASVIGRQFPYDLLAMIAEIDDN